MTEAEERTSTASLALGLLAVDPFGLGGVILKGRPGPGRDAWVAALRATMPAEAPWKRLPAATADARLLGGLDLAATLAAGRPVAERGLLAEAHGGAILVPMAERLAAGTVAHLGAALDTGEIVAERDGLTRRDPACFVVILLDEGANDEGAGDERVATALSDRVAFIVDEEELGGDPRPATMPPEARTALAGVIVPDDIYAAICFAGIAFGAPSLRLATLAVRAAKAAAVLAGRDTVLPQDAELAAALVIAPRATRLPASSEDQPEEVPDAPDPEDRGEAEDAQHASGEAMSDRVVEAVRAAIPADLLAALAGSSIAAPRKGPEARGTGSMLRAPLRGRPAGTRRGAPTGGVRLAIVDTLRAAAPWQRIRRQGGETRVLVRREDFRVPRLKAHREAVTIFVVDASGSAALHRLAEVKGAVELILAECYVRRDQVALLAFRGQGAELLLPPTRSLARAKRALAGLPGGGGTPLGAALESAAQLAVAVRRKGQTPLVVLMTDGKANVARSGRGGRAEAEADAQLAARAFRVEDLAALLLDVAPRPTEAARRLAVAMGARYIPLPYADAQMVSRTVLAAGVNAAAAGS